MGALRAHTACILRTMQYLPCNVLPLAAGPAWNRLPAPSTSIAGPGSGCPRRSYQQNSRYQQAPSLVVTGRSNNPSLPFPNFLLSRHPIPSTHRRSHGGPHFSAGVRCRDLAGELGSWATRGTPRMGLRWLGDRSGYRVGSLSARKLAAGEANGSSSPPPHLPFCALTVQADRQLRSCIRRLSACGAPPSTAAVAWFPPSTRFVYP